MKSLKKIIYKMKESLVKKVVVNQYRLSNSEIIFDLKLINFFRLKKEINVYFENKKELLEIPFIYDNKTLSIKLPYAFLENIRDRSNIIIYINNQRMWLTPGRQYSFTHIIANQKYYKPYINKDITIVNRFSEYMFSQKTVTVGVNNVSYDKIVCEVKDESLHIPSNQEVECFGIRGSKIVAISTNYDPDKKELQLEGFELFSTGLWRFFINQNNNLQPLELYDQKLIEFDTYNHIVEIMSRNLNFYFRFKPRILECDQLVLNRKSDETIELIIKNVAKVAPHLNFNFIIKDTTTGDEMNFPIEVIKEHLVGTIDTNHLLHSFFKKSFFIELTGDTPKRFQFNLNKTNLVEDGLKILKNNKDELLTIKFYKRKDKSLGLFIRRPRIRKYVTEIKDFTLKGYLGPLDGFERPKAYLCVEERDSEIRELLPIKGKFKIDLLDYDLLGLQNKDKSILDLFVVIKNRDNEIIRKEKIKYIYADYKKDNYYDRKIIMDAKNNQRYFLITTTPFDNLKIEAFIIPHFIDIPKTVETKEEDVWLIGERYNTAQDNGIVFFEWLRSNTNIQAYYVIESDSEDYQKIKDNPYVLKFGSKEHFEIALKASVLLGTHDLENLLPYKAAEGFYYYENTLKVFLQHGVLGRKSVEYNKKYYDQPFDLIIVSSVPEKDDIVVNQWGYEPNEVAVTGLARFDRLIQAEPPKNLLLMPTWRDWINTQERFLASKYYAKYSSLIKNPRLLKILEEYDVYLNFYPHYRAQNFFEKDAEEIGGRVNFIPFGSKSVQQLLIEHALLITDYSSVSFDFILMNKPVIHYHFDDKRFFKDGILRPIEETFIGKIAYHEEELIDYIEDRIKHQFENYDVDISGVIKYQDHSNCERIYQAIISSIKENNKV
ncbi:CDP-glycerol glycerophosphotransferase family protein [Pseudogracilibacillus sp. SO30301A]|uniref:CDP-glycerol glycerophosphotransferase family protein n=1 Tax=Pseudogracilibacillus sp. SO30301A TaxID=3098291 RepID=UPI00300DEA5C